MFCGDGIDKNQGYYPFSISFSLPANPISTWWLQLTKWFALLLTSSHHPHRQCLWIHCSFFWLYLLLSGFLCQKTFQLTSLVFAQLLKWSVFIWVIFYCSLESSQDNQGSLKLGYTGSYIFVIKVSDSVLNYENDCKVISELSNEACSHSVGLSYFQWYPINMWYVFVPLLRKGNYEGGK